MAKVHASGKRLQIDKANSTMIITVAVAAFVVTLTIVAGRSLMNTRAYQARIIKEKEVAAKQLKSNLEATQKLTTAYQAFVQTSDNIIGGNPNGTGERDGDNAKIVLDALPSKYDYPALATSLEKILSSKNQKLNSIEGSDDEVAQSTAEQKPVPVEMPFGVNVGGDFASAKDLLSILERSIRPIKIRTIDFSSGQGSSLDIQVSAVTYYQPAKTLKIETKDVK